MSRAFRVPEGRIVTMPRRLLPGPGDSFMRVQPGQVVVLDDQRLIDEQRFVNGRLHAGDLIEIDLADVPAESPPPTEIPSPYTAIERPYTMSDLKSSSSQLLDRLGKKEG